MKKFVFALISGLLAAFSLQAQPGLYPLDADNDGGVFIYNPSEAAATMGLCDNGGIDGVYTSGDYTITVQGTSPSATLRFCLVLTELDIDCGDTLYIYDGPDATGEVRAKINNCTGYEINRQIFVSPTNTSGMLTVRFHSGSNSGGHRGFALNASIQKPCEMVVPAFKAEFYRTRNGVIYDTSYIRPVPVYDTAWNILANGDTVGYDHIDTTYFDGAHLCIGDGVIFNARGIYSYYHGYYQPADSTSTFIWNMDNGGDSIVVRGGSSITYSDYQQTGCHDMTIKIVDAFGCTTGRYTSVRVRTATNPIKTIFTLADICNTDSLMVNMGYSGENATLTLREVEAAQTVSKINEVRTFIPDGPNCNPSDPCYHAPVEFTEFPSSRRVQSASDICSICINMEHTFMGDITVYIKCPTGQQAPLFFGQNNTTPRDGRNETGGAGDDGSGQDMGYSTRPDSGCDSLNNPFGAGLDYCFSRNSAYTLVTGQPASEVIGRPNGQFYITYNSAQYSLDVSNGEYLPLPAGFPARSTTTYSSTTKLPSNHEEKTDYYIPYTDFSELIGCPLNGVWEIVVCDEWGIDNGWVFNWSLDICGVSQDEDCKYTVGIDSLVWVPDSAPQYHDYDLGHYRGLEVHRETPTVSYITSPDTAGYFPIIVKVYDEFGCVWDTNTSITTYWTPEPSLGNDTTLCGVERMTLDATDRHTATENYTYVWEPNGDETPTIVTPENPGNSILYVAQVTNTRNNNRCIARDSIVIRQSAQPLPTFVPNPFSFEGCDPFTVSFENQSVNADHHLWDFGDGVTSTLRSPTHTYPAGTYTLKYYAYSDAGCVDSVVSQNGITVFPSPDAAFSWTPTYPSVMDPAVVFTNLTQPQTDDMEYFWQMQYNPDNPLSVETLTTKDAIFNFAQYSAENPTGNYGVRLIARTTNLAPSGRIIECRDTAENLLLVINDFLQFPNVVTPNGDGINDRFVIGNLVEGKAYPYSTLDIYNKWGARVFHRENISSDSDFWDPADMPDGTYFYRFTARGYSGNIEHNGAIEVIH